MTCPLIIVRLKFLEEDTFPEPPSVQGKAAQELETIYKAIRKLRSKATGSVEILEAQALEDPKDLTLFIGTPSNTRAQLLLPNAIFDPLLPYLITPPTICTVNFPDSFYTCRRGNVFDVHILEIPKDSSDLDNFERVTLMDMELDLRMSMPLIEIYKSESEQMTSPGDMRMALTGWAVESHDTSVKSFVLVVEWADEEAAARFKDPNVPNVYLEGVGLGTSGDALWNEGIYGPLVNYPGSGHSLDSVTTCIKRKIPK